MKKIYIIVCMVLLSFLFTKPILAQYSGPKPTVTTCVYHDVSPPLTTIVPHPSLPKAIDLTENELPDQITPPKAGALPIGEDPVWQKENGSKGTVTPYRNFEAIRNSDNSSGVAPPDSDGDIGPNHYFAMVNNSFQIFNRAGTSLYGPAGSTTIWDGWSGYYGQSISDPIVLYDEQADRWFASVMTTSTYGGLYYILCAVSTTSSPTGTWYRYAWSFSSLPDYPKYGIWPDGYYLGLNRTGDDVLVLERSVMLTGGSADMVSFDNPGKPVPNNTTFNCVLPSDCDGTFPPYGTPNYFWAIGDDAWAAYSYDRLLVWEFHVDWATPSNSTWTGPTAIATAAFDATFNAFGAGEITQPGTTQVLDCIPWVLMFRPQFRNFGTYYSLVCNHSVDVDATNHAGVRWYELRKTTGGWYIRQQNTYSPDGNNRWMGSVAMNAKGDIALGYSVSSTSTYPSIRFTGRLADDALGTMTFTESNIWAGSYSQTDTRRWGDYSMMSVDPVNDHSFWYISEYNGNYGGWADWITQVAAFTLDDYCAASGGCVEYISNVNIGTINNTTVCEQYSNYTNLSTNIDNDATAALAVTIGNYYSGDYIFVWVDWNDDNDFSDANEYVGNDGSAPFSFTIDPPSGVILGEHRMRIRLTYSSTADPCGITNYGEVEDYSLNITGSPGLWKGTVSTAWNNGANWDDGTVPTSAVDVTIPAGTPFQPVISSGVSANCKNITIQSGANLTQNPTSYLHVYGDFNSDAGQFTMSGNTYMYFEGSSNNSWDDDNENDSYTTVVIDKSITTAQTTIWQNMTVSSQVQVWTGILAIDATWTLNITGTIAEAFNVHNGGKLVLNDETITCAGGVHFWDNSQAEINGGTINCAGNFTVDANTSYNVAFTGGTLVMNGSSTQYINDLDGGNLDLFNLTIAKTGGVCYIQSANLDVNGAVLISGGALSANNAPTPTASYNIKVGSNWTNTVGAGGFVPGTGTVVFHSLTGAAQDAEGINTFYNVLQDNTGQYLRFNLTNGNTTIQNNLELHHYSWAYRLFNVNGILNIDDVNSRFTSNGPNGVATIASLNQGGRLISNGGGSLTVNDLVENGLFGSYYVNSASDFMQITNSGTGTYVDLAADLHILGGTMKINGTISWWPYGGNAAIEMTGGVLDLTGCGIYINNNVSLSLNDNITGGTIRTISGFSGNRADFTPTAGTFEFYGPDDATISQSNGCTLYNVNINKGTKDGFISKPESAGSDERKDETWGGGGKANSISLGSNFTITNNLTITAGSFVLNGFQANVTNNCDVYGTLTMNNALDILNVGTNYEDALTFYSGSSGNFNFGTVNIYGWIRPRLGCFFSATTNNTVYFKGVTGGGPWCDEPTAVYGHMVVDKNPGERTYASASSSQPITLLGNFTVNPNNEFELQNNTMHVNGFLTDNTSSEIYAWDTSKNSSSKSASVPDEAKGIENSTDTDNNTGIEDTGSKGGYLEIDNNFTLNGLMDVGDGNVLIHGMFNVAASGTLTITTGSLICDAPSTSVAYVAGNFNLGEGLYEIRNNSLNMYPVTSSITGGIIKAGGTFIANMADRFKPGFGTVELINGVNGHYIQMHSTNYFNYLIINRSYPIGIYSGTSLTVKKDLTINAGGLNSNNLPIYLGGHWNENMGPAGFGEGTGTVYFNGVGAVPFGNQYINGSETFYNIENAKSGGGNLFFDGAITVSNNFLANDENIVNGPSLDVNNLLLSTGILGLTTGAPNVTVNNFTMGGYLSVTDGNFTCNDVVNNGIFGTITMYNGSITLFQDALQWCDLNASVTINGGYMAINNGNGASVWGYAAPCNITMNGGLLDFNNNGIYISTTPYPVTQNITGGTIKTDQMFFCDRSTFTPAGGTVEMYAGTDAYVVAANNSHIFNLLINKSGGVKESGGKGDKDAFKLNETNPSVSSIDGLLSAEPGKRPVFPEITSKANEIFNGGVLKVMGTTMINAGTLRLTGYPVTSMGNININTGGKLQLTETSSLAIENGKTLTVNNGGILDVNGSAAFPALITRNSGFYGLNVESGATIGAVYGVFEYMNTNGVNIKNGAVVNVLKPFNNCTFRNGQAAGRLMSVENNQTFYVENAVFPPNTWGGAYNVYKAVNAGGVYFVTATGGFAGATYEYDPNSRIFWTERSLSLKAYLEGPFNGTNMNTTLNGILPLSHPFNPALPYFGNPLPDWRFTGAGNVGAIPNVNIVDWVLVELRDAAAAAAATKATMIAQFPAFILNNGNIVSLSGSSNLQFSNVIVNNLFVVIYQRNHVSIMNANPVPYTAGAYTYDYTTGAAQVYGGAPAHKQMATGIWGMRSGDGNGDCDVLMNDKTQVWGIPTQLGKTGYLPSDYNFDRQTNNKDKNDKWVPNNPSYSSVPN